MSVRYELLDLAEKVANESCIDYPVQWIADRIREIANRSAA